jgi:antitoxin YefM
MITISANLARATLYQLIDQIADSHLPVTITGPRNDAVLISAAD